MKKAALTIVIIVFVLALPVIFKDRSNPLKHFTGTRLTDLEYVEVEFTNLFDSTHLAGLLFLPEKQGPVPVIVFIQGSGNSYRTNSWYLSLVKAIVDNGSAVLLPDKRGCEKSGGNWVGVGPEVLATDTDAAVEYVLNQKIFETQSIGLLGVSQGGWIAPIVNRSNISFIINLSATMANGEEQLLFEEVNNISKYTYRFIAKLIAPITTKKLMERKAVKVFADFDPMPYWNKVSIPVFCAFGGNDPNSPIELGRERINNPEKFEFKVYPDGRHAILDESKTKIRDDFLYDMNAFIRRNTRRF